jgi:putative OPT family oligopeptide transporter
MSHRAPPELTPRAIILAIVLAMILAGANAYLGLFAGMTIASAIPAAVVSMAVLKLLGGGHILENNIVATGASAGTSIATGVIFTLPALMILGYWDDFRYSWVLGARHRRPGWFARSFVLGTLTPLTDRGAGAGFS